MSSFEGLQIPGAIQYYTDSLVALLLYLFKCQCLLIWMKMNLHISLNEHRECLNITDLRLENSTAIETYISRCLLDDMLSLDTNDFLFSLFASQHLSVLWTPDLADVFHLTVIFTVFHFHLVHLRQCLWISLHRIKLLRRLYTGTLNLPTHLHSVSGAILLLVYIGRRPKRCRYTFI